MTFPLADALCWLLAARQFILDVIELETKGAENPALADGLAGTVAFFTDLCHVQAARAAGEVGRICAEIVHGYNRHPAWDDASCHACYGAEELTALEGIIPGIDGSARAYSDVAEPGEAHPPKAGPCVKCDGLGSLRRASRQTGHLPDRLPAGQRPGRRIADQGHDARGAGLSGVSNECIPA